MYIGPPGESNIITQSNENNLNYVHKNTTVRVQKTTEGSVIVYPNFRVHPGNVIQSEVPIVTHPINKNIMFGSSNAVTLSPLFLSEGVYVTTDGGNSWFGSDTTKTDSLKDNGGDPAPSIDMNGRFYQSYLSFSGTGLWATNSTDNGNSWAPATKIIIGSQDKNHTFTINNASSPFNGRTFIVWSRFTASLPPIAVSYTSDNGTTWSGYVDINVSDSNHYSQGANGAVAPNGDIYVCWQNPINKPPNTGDYIGFGKSSDGGVTWTYNDNIYDCNGIRGTLKSSEIRVNDFPWMAIDKSSGPRNGWIYIVTAEKNLSPAGSDPDIVLHRSSDDGATWSGGIRVNQDPLNNGKDQYMPCIIVDQVGAIDVVYYDNRNTTNDSTQVFISRSIDGGSTWEDIQVSDHAFRPVPISGLSHGYQGDYIGITEGPNSTIWPYWADNISGIYQAWITKVVFTTYPLNAFNLNTPVNGTTVTSFPKGSGIINFLWDTASSSATYKWTFGSPAIADPKLEFKINTNTLSFNTNQLDTLLASIGVNQGDSLIGEWSVVAYRNNLPVNDTLQSANSPRSIILKRGKPELIAFNLNSPPDKTRILTSVFTYNDLTFNWNRSGDGIKYRLKFGQTLANPIIDTKSNNEGYDSTWSISNYLLDQLLQKGGLANGDSIQGIWAVYSYSGSDSLKSVQSNNLTLVRKTKGEFLIAYDSTQTNGIISRDSVINNLNLLNKTFDLFNKEGNLSRNVLSFREYNYVVWLGEGSSVMSVIQKDSMKAYLNSGTLNNLMKSKLIIFSEDIGYQLDRTTSVYQDTAFSRGMLGFEYIADAPMSGANQVIFGDEINSGIADSTIGSWPDVLKPSWLSGKRLYGYSGYLADTGCGIGNIGAKWNTAVFGTDIRALRSAYKSPEGSPVTRILSGAIGWINESTTPVEVIPLNHFMPGNVEYVLDQNYPNPFNPSTSIKYSISHDGIVNLSIYNILGEKVITLVNQNLRAGKYEIKFDGAHYPSGIYFYKLESGYYTSVKKMILMK